MDPLVDRFKGRPTKDKSLSSYLSSFGDPANMILVRNKKFFFFFFFIKMKGYFKTQGIQALLRTENFKGSSFCFVLFSLMWFRSLFFLFVASVQLHQLLFTCQGNGRGRGWSCGSSSAVLARAVLA